MPLGKVFTRAMTRTRSLPIVAQLGATVGITVTFFVIRNALSPVIGGGYPFLLGFLGVLLSSSLFNGGAGMISAALSTAIAAWVYMAPRGSFDVTQAGHLLAIAIFLLVSGVTALLVETLHSALADLQETERRRLLLLGEYKHRTKNDLQSLVALLLLRARAANSEEARLCLREAADHARALARVQVRLQEVAAGDDDEPVVRSRGFIGGLVEDLQLSAALNGLRPIAFHAHLEDHPIASERAVQLGLVLNEVITNALKYAFPDDRAGMVQVRFVREGEDFSLEIRDDGIGGAPPAMDPRAGLGSRLLRALAAQLRGSVRRDDAPGGGTVVELRFPACAPTKLNARN